jgi:hypothetical protein
MYELNGSKITKLGSIEDGYKRSSIHMVGDRPYMGIPQWWILSLRVDAIKN